MDPAEGNQVADLLQRSTTPQLRPPARGALPRPRLVERLAEATDRRLVLLDAPVGYGKTTLLAQWTGGRPRRVGWLSLEEADSDPGTFLAHLVGSLEGAVPGLARSMRPRTGAPGPFASSAAVEGVLEGLRTAREPLLIVIDDYHVLQGRGPRSMIESIVMGLPPHVQVAISTRADPALPLGRLRASGDLFELRAADLRFDEREATAILRAAGVALGADDVATLVERTEGWPAGIYLAALSLRDEADPSGFVQRFAGTHRHVADYLSEEVVRRQPPRVRAFLTRTSILDRMSGALCDAVLDAPGSQVSLESLERSNVFIVPLDDERRWYRYHQLFQEMLHAELVHSEPELVPDLHRRASRWLENEGSIDGAISHAIDAGDRQRAGTIVAREWLRYLNEGRLETVRHWLGRLGDDAIEGQPELALTAAWISALSGEPERTGRWIEVAQAGPVAEPLPDGTPSMAAGIAALRGLFAFEGLDDAERNLRRALELGSPTSVWYPYLVWGIGHTALLRGDLASAARSLADAVRLSPDDQPIAAIMASADLAMVELGSGRLEEAASFHSRAEQLVRRHALRDDPRTCTERLAAGLILIERGEFEAGHRAMEEALALRTAFPRLSRWPTLQILLELAPIRSRVGDAEGARTLLADARVLLDGQDDAGPFAERIERVERLVRGSQRELEFGERLTERELAILRLLPTHLTRREIGGELFLSVNTVKSHCQAIYRKLGVSSRTDAVVRARQMELL